jgi:hypothetical protein
VGNAGDLGIRAGARIGLLVAILAAGKQQRKNVLERQVPLPGRNFEIRDPDGGAF